MLLLLGRVGPRQVKKVVSHRRHRANSLQGAALCTRNLIDPLTRLVRGNSDVDGLAVRGIEAPPLKFRRRDRAAQEECCCRNQNVQRDNTQAIFAYVSDHACVFLFQHSLCLHVIYFYTCVTQRTPWKIAHKTKQTAVVIVTGVYHKTDIGNK